MEIVQTVEAESAHHEGVIEKQAAQIYRLSAIVEALAETLINAGILTEKQITDNF